MGACSTVVFVRWADHDTRLRLHECKISIHDCSNAKDVHDRLAGFCSSLVAAKLKKVVLVVRRAVTRAEFGWEDGFR